MGQLLLLLSLPRFNKQPDAAVVWPAFLKSFISSGSARKKMWF